MEVPFTKMSGAGNDFVVIDRRSMAGTFDGARYAPILCDRRRGVGGDGLILISESRTHDFTMEYFNADGSTGSMCGNGGRCAAALVMGTGGAAPTVFESCGRVYRAVKSPGGIILDMDDPGEPRLEIDLGIGGVNQRGHFIDTGSPHLVILTDSPDFDSMDIHDSGRMIRNSGLFQPSGTNVDFVKVVGEGDIIVRTYERGVEGETLACGTGAVASAIIADTLSGTGDRPGERTVRVTPRSGERLCVRFRRDAGRISAVSLEGPAVVTFTGTFDTTSSSPD